MSCGEEDVIEVSRGHKPSALNNWRSTLTVTLTCVAWRSVVPSARAQKSESPTMVASLSISTIQPEFFLTTAHERANYQALRLTHSISTRIIEPTHALTDGEAWEQFETEFGPQHPSPSPVQRQIETAKYVLDTTVFAVDRFVKSLRDHADFNFDQGHLRHAPVTPLGRSRDDPHVKLDLDLTHGRPYAGVRLVIPFGN